VVTDTYGPFVTKVPLTEFRGNRLMWFVDITPHGSSLQLAVGQRTLVVGWLTKRERLMLGFHSYGWCWARRPSH